MTALSDVLDPLTITHWFRQPSSGVLTSQGDTGGISLGSPTGAIQGQAHPVAGEYMCYFDGVDDNHKAAVTTGTINLSTGTVAILFNLDAGADFSKQRLAANFITNAGGAIGMAAFFEITTGNFIFRLQNTYPTNHYSLSVAAANHNWNDGQNHLLAVVQNGTSPTVYMDGEDVTSRFTASSAGSLSATSWLNTLISAGANRIGLGAFGGSPTNAHNFQGYIGDMIITSAQLTPTNISDIATVMGVAASASRKGGGNAATTVSNKKKRQRREQRALAAAQNGPGYHAGRWEDEEMTEVERLLRGDPV